VLFMNSMRQLNKLAVVLAVLLVSACTPKQPALVLPTGDVELIGTIKPLVLTANSKGTHNLVLQQTGSYIAKSSLVNLRNYEGKEVTIKGFAEQNSLDYVVTIGSVVLVHNESLMRTTLEDNRISIELPESWQVKQSNGEYIVHANQLTEPILIITTVAEVPTLTADLFAVDGKKFVLQNDEPGIYNGYLQSDPVLRFAFTDPNEQILSSDLVKTIVQTIKTVQVTQSSSSVSITASGSISSGIKYCGGLAGILCPAGFYCNIQDAASNTGICTAL
jgi:hypothetical protein